MSSRSGGGRHRYSRHQGGRGGGGGRGGRGGRGGPSGQGYRGQAPRNHERAFFDKMTLSDDSSGTIRSSSESIRFLKAALAFAAAEGGPGLLYRLSDKCGKSGLRKSLEYISDAHVFTEGFLPLVDRLGQDDLHKPVYQAPMKALLSSLYEMRFLVPSIRSQINLLDTLRQNDKATALAWLFAKLALESEDARQNQDIKAIAEKLATFGCADRLKTVLGGECPPGCEVSLNEIRDQQSEQPGGRHDNDKLDFRSIAIVPTCQEFQCEADPYMPIPTDNRLTTEASLLERHFRLLREDIIGPSKENQDDPRKQQRDIFYGARPARVECGSAVFRGEGQSRVRQIGETDPCIMFKFKVPSWFRVNSMASLKAKADYWEKNKRILSRDALVCLQRKNSHGEWAPTRFGIIVRRETKELASDQPMIGIRLVSTVEIEETLKELSDPQTPPTRLVVVSADLFAYQPILQGLQMMDEIPFKDEIVHAMPSLPAEGPSIVVPLPLISTVEGLDPGQRSALDTAMKDRVALIQGPPGTGKVR